MSSLADRIAERAATLPVDRQAEALDFIEFLHTRARPENQSALPRRPTRTLGSLEGQLVVPGDFDAPLPPELLRAFEGDDGGDARPPR
jgi:hypothetical protein